MSDVGSPTQRPSSAPRRSAPPAPRGGAGGVGAVYVLGLVGALVHYWQQAVSSGDHVLAVLKSFVWPALLVYDALRAVKG